MLKGLSRDINDELGTVRKKRRARDKGAFKLLIKRRLAQKRSEKIQEGQTKLARL